jgi:nucleotide-binding universal stress UspA family protein
VQGFREILVAIEFTPTTHRVFEAALRVLEPGGRVRLLHVVEWVPSVVEGTLVRYANPRDTRRLHEASLGQLRRYAAQAPGVRVDPEVVEGQPAASILEAAAQPAVDLIVLGRGKPRGLVSSHPGSIVERVVTEARCPVLLVPL